MICRICRVDDLLRETGKCDIGSLSHNKRCEARLATNEQRKQVICMLNRLLGIVVCVLILIGGGSAALGEERVGISRFLFLPFDSSSAGKYAYLADGVHSMLASRLAAKSGVKLVDSSVHEMDLKQLEAAGVDKQKAAAVFTRLQTDFLVSGAVYATDSRLKVQVVVTSAESTAEPQSFTAVAEGEDHIISAIGSLADNIVDKVINRRHPETIKTVDAEVEGMAGFQTEHPEKQYKKGLYGGGAIVSSEGSGVKVTAKGVKRSSTIPVVIVAMDTGDLDGDGEAEIVFVSSTELQVFRYSGGKFQKIGSHTFKPTFKIHAVNTADLDRDGKAEIYISANEQFRVASMILRWSAADGLTVQQDNIAWFLRPLDLPGEGLILAGQMSSNDPARGFVGTGIYRLEKKADGKIHRGAKLPVPDRVNLFDFVWADIDGDRTSEIVAIDRNEKLLVYDDQGNLTWVSEGNYGGSRNYFGPSRAEGERGGANSVASVSADDRDLAFIPTRPVAGDIDGDGQQEIIIGRNKRMTPLFFRNFREYDGGSIACLGWRDSALSEIWTTNTIPGYISDYSFILAKDVGARTVTEANAQLFVGQVPDSTFLGFLAARESKILVYEIELPKK